jgi:hypothetical protein
MASWVFPSLLYCTVLYCTVLAALWPLQAALRVGALQAQGAVQLTYLTSHHCASFNQTTPAVSHTP